jgi:small multidrug resistance family-3 protein
VYAIYGGYFILLALLWGWAVDKQRPDVGDVVGACIAIAGAFIMFFWPRAKAQPA